MLKFYDVDVSYADYLRSFDTHVPHITYTTNNKFVCGIVLSVEKCSYFVPVSSQKVKQQTSLPIRDESGNIISSLKFCFMFPAPLSVVREKNFSMIRKTDSKYADLLEKEYAFCKKNEAAILEKAQKVYQIGCNPNHVLNKYCCNFPLLETAQQQWLASHHSEVRPFTAD